MNPRYHEIHRVEIKRQLYRHADQQWDALFGLFIASIIFAGFGVKLCFAPISGSWIIGFVFFSLSALFFRLLSVDASYAEQARNRQRMA